MKLSKNDLKIFAMLAVFFGILLLVSNPLDLTNFPQRLSIGSITGMVVFLAGLIGFWYGAQ